jgi:hypothetical protein
MIRREINLASGEKLWLLISQVEHARVSGELVANLRESFADDVVNAIRHHDDGWAAWEAEPKLNPEIGAPFSFLEMPVAAALVIWDHSIAAAEKFGPLAAYMVAGHFYNLLSNSENANDPLANAWLTAKRKQRTTWLDEWVRAEPAPSLEYPKAAQQRLLIADLFSLWLCCEAPLATDQTSILGNSPMKLQTGVLFDQYKLSVHESRIAKSASGGRLESLNWTIGVSPSPFATSPFKISARASAAPYKKYATWSELKAASWPVELHWRLVESESMNGSPGEKDLAELR